MPTRQFSLSTVPYRGRFAPSPSGPLHFGSLVTAVGSYLEACRHGGQWLVRIDDIDPPREEPGAADRILRTLSGFGLQWDGEVIYQSQRLALYQDALDQLRRSDLAYGCACTRREIAAVASRGPNGLIYPGTCRNGLPSGREARAWRVRCGDSRIRFNDRFQGLVDSVLSTTVGDFVVRRADGHFAYHLAAAVDDADHGITHVVRGFDLLWCTPPQRHLQNLLGLETPGYGHLPVVVNRQGQKLSKQNRAQPLDPDHPTPALWDALAVLRQQPPQALREAPLDTLWDWALKHWRPAMLRGLSQVDQPTPDDARATP